jgi:hypothetical protein
LERVRTGVFLDLPTGPHIQDVVASVGALSSEDPIIIGILNGILKDGGTWGPLIEHGPARVSGWGSWFTWHPVPRGHPGLVMIWICSDLR